jgi:hypothetical protein
LHPIQSIDGHPNTKSAIVDYRELTSDSAAAIERLYHDLDLPMTEEFRETLAAQGKRERKHNPDHAYSLEQFGLESDSIRTELEVLFDRFGWDKDDATEANDGAAGPA